jgi:hypothetical protein
MATLALARETGLSRRHPDAFGRVATERSTERARLHVARALLAERLDTGWLSTLDPDEARRELELVGERLALAESLADESLRTLPVSWEAAMILGGARFMGWLSSGDERLLTDRARWERPLVEALALAPGHPEPPRLLGAARLVIWPLLEPGERQATKDLLRRAFEDEATFNRLAPLWLRAAQNVEEAFSLVPERPTAWRVILRIFGSRGDWRDYAHAWRRWDAALLSELAELGREVDERIEAGDVRGARHLALLVATRCRRDLRYAPTISRCFERSPAGMANFKYGDELRPLLDWVLELCVQGECPLGPRPLARLAAAAGELPPVVAALASLAAGDWPEAERHERRSRSLETEAWRRYLLLKARLLAERGDAAAATAVLDRLPGLPRRDLHELRVREAVAHAAGDGPSEAAQAKMLRRLAARQWRASAWRYSGRLATLELLPSASAQELEIKLGVFSPRGSVVEVRWDGAMVAVEAVKRGATLLVAVDVTPDTHVLEVEAVAGGGVVPGEVRLRLPAPSG